MTWLIEGSIKSAINRVVKRDYFDELFEEESSESGEEETSDENEANDENEASDENESEFESEDDIPLSQLKY